MLIFFKPYVSEIITALLTFGLSWLLFKVTSKQANLVYFNPSLWKLPDIENAPSTFGGALFVQNNGNAPAKNVRVIYSKDLVSQVHFEVSCAWPHRMEKGPDGNLVITLDHLPPKHGATVSVATRMNSLEPLYVGHEDGGGKVLPHVWQRAYPKWVNYLSIVFMFYGLASFILDLTAFAIRHWPK